MFLLIGQSGELHCDPQGELPGGGKLVGWLSSPCCLLGLGQADRWPGIEGPRVLGRGLGRWEHALLSPHALFSLLGVFSAIGGFSRADGMFRSLTKTPLGTDGRSAAIFARASASGFCFRGMW